MIGHQTISEGVCYRDNMASVFIKEETIVLVLTEDIFAPIRVCPDVVCLARFERNWGIVGHSVQDRVKVLFLYLYNPRANESLQNYFELLQE